MEFCYIARHDAIAERTLTRLQDGLECFHHYRTIFEEIGICPDGFALPRQHAMSHYMLLIRLFAAPNGLCSSITELKHIKAIKEPWRRSNRYKALEQMLLTNQRIDKLAAARVDFTDRRMLEGTVLSKALSLLSKICIFFLYFNLCVFSAEDDEIHEDTEVVEDVEVNNDDDNDAVVNDLNISA